MKPRVSITRCTGYATESVLRSVNEAVELLGGMSSFVKPGERILVKPNLLAGKPPEKAVTTHPEVVRAVVELVKEAGAVPLVGDSPGLGSPAKVAEKCGVMAAALDSGAEFLPLSTLTWVENPGGHTFKRLEVAEEALGVDGIINVPKLKTHAQMYLTMGVKNLFGCVPGTRKPQWHLTAGTDFRGFAAMLLDLHDFLCPRLNIMDGVVGMEGNGPGSGTPREIGIVAASASAVAMDTVAASILGADAEKVPLLKEAALRGLPEADPENVEVVGEDPDEMRVEGFEFPPQVSVDFLEKLPYFLEKRVRNALTARPSVNHKACTLCNVCVRVCPAEVMTDDGRIEIDYDRCIRCYCCQEMCPEGAITSKKGWLKRIIPGL